MALFDNVLKAAKDVGNAATKAASTVGTSTISMGGGKEQKEINQLNGEISQIDSELNELYQFIGKKYVEYLAETKAISEIDIEEQLKAIEMNKIQKTEIALEVEEVNKRIKQQDGIKEKMQERKKAEVDFSMEKAKLDRALDEKIISQDEYDVKLQTILSKLNEV